jgi:molybdopterin molybdotransferase
MASARSYSGVLERGFNRLLSEAEALARLLEVVRPIERDEELPLESAAGRVLFRAPLAPRDAPHYDRSAMDGFALLAAETAGASPAGPMRLRLADTSGPGLAVPVRTGAPLPAGADAVLPAEDAERDDPWLDVQRQLRVGENVGRRGEDVRKGEVVAPEGQLLRPADLGLLRALGVERVRVAVRPRVRVIATGEELVAPGTAPEPGRVVDGNGLLLAAAAAAWGGEPELAPLYSDDRRLLTEALTEAAAVADLIVTSGGTSVGERDQVVEALVAAGKVIFHGVAIQPARPVAAGVVRGVPVLCLPGFPAAAFIAAFAFLRPVLARLARRPRPEPRTVRAPLARKIVSTLGLRTYVRVRVGDGRVEPLRSAGAGVLSSVARAHGFVIVPENTEGIAEGVEVEVVLID